MKQERNTSQDTSRIYLRFVDLSCASFSLFLCPDFLPVSGLCHFVPRTKDGTTIHFCHFPSFRLNFSNTLSPSRLLIVPLMSPAVPEDLCDKIQACQSAQLQQACPTVDPPSYR